MSSSANAADAGAATATATATATAASSSHRQQKQPEQRTRRRRRRSSTAAAEALVSTAREVEARVEQGQALLVLWDELPAWRRDNAFIRTGYRRTSGSVRASVASLLYLHNETVNIWTHLLGAVAAAVGGVLLLLRTLVAPRYSSASSSDRLVFACFFAGAVLCLGMSATFHTLCNHSPEVARWGNKLDYTGIVFLIVGSYVPALYYGFFCHPNLLTVYLGAVSVLRLRLANHRHSFVSRSLILFRRGFFFSDSSSTDYSAGPRLPGCFVVRALPHACLAPIPGSHVCRPRPLRGRAHPPRPQFLRLPRARPADGPQLGHSSRRPVHFRRLHLCREHPRPAMHPLTDVQLLTRVVGPMARTSVPGGFRYLGEFPSDIPCLCSSRRGNALVWHDQGI